MRRVSVVFAAAGLLAALPVHAEEAAEERDEEDPRSLSYWVSGGVIPFVYGTGALGVAIGLGVDPRDQPLGFSASEGGAEHRGDTVPSWTLAVGGGLTASMIALAPSRARWFHLKGHTQAWVTTFAITQAFKRGFGRHRPDFILGEENPKEARLSFLSGHASSAVTHLTYAALFLRFHGFAELRGERALPWWEALTYVGLASAAVYVPATRVIDNRHHVTDVIAGAALGVASSAAFFAWQELRYRRGRGAESSPVIISPDVENRGLTLGFAW